MLMQPRPRAETSRLLFPSVRFCIAFPFSYPRVASLIVVARASELTIGSTKVAECRYLVLYAGNDAGGAQALGRNDGAQTDRAISDNGDHAAWLYAGAHGRVV